MDDHELRAILKPLFAQFATADGDAEAKFMGYVIALHRASPEALQAAVRSYLCGEVVGHDGKFLPTSAEVARVVRAEQAHLNRITPRLQLVAPDVETLSEETIARRLAKLRALKATLDETIAAASMEGRSQA